MSNWFRSYGYGEVHPNLIVGAYPLDAGDVEQLRVLGVQRVLNLVQDSEYEFGDRVEIEAALSRAGIAETRMSLVDFGRLPADRLEQAVTTVAAWVSQGERVYVHCRAGWQRSAAVAAGTVAALRDLPIERALDQVKTQKPSADPLPHQREDLRAWWEGRSSRPIR